MRTGASGVCSMGGLTSECNSGELRFWYGDEQLFKDNLKYCIEHNIYAICNLDFHKWDSHYPFDINRLTDMLTIMAECGATKSNSRITVENEPMKYWSREEYCDMVSQVYTRVNGDYFVGANNEEFGLGAARNLYPYLFENAEFDYFDIHIQSTMINPETWRVNFETVRHWLSTSRAWATTYGKKLSCTEANWSKIKEETGHKDLMQERELARQYGCEDFNIVFIDGKLSQYNWLSYLFNGVDNTAKYDSQGNLISSNWHDLRQKMLDEKEQPKWEDNDMKIKTIGHKTNDVKSGYGVQLLHELLVYKEYMIDEDISSVFTYTDKTKKAVEDFQRDLNIVVDGRAGRNVWRSFINSITDSVIKGDYRFNLEVVMSPYNDNGDT